MLFHPELVDAVWAAAEPLLPRRRLTPIRWAVTVAGCLPGLSRGHPIPLVTGCAWVTAEAICGNRVSDTTSWGRRDEMGRSRGLRQPGRRSPPRL